MRWLRCAVEYPQPSSSQTNGFSPVCVRIWRSKLPRCAAAYPQPSSSQTYVPFVYLKGIHTLVMRGCDQAGITDAAFVHLKGIHTLVMRGCDQAGITDAVFVHLKGIHSLNMSQCKQPSITQSTRNRLRASVPRPPCERIASTRASFSHQTRPHQPKS